MTLRKIKLSLYFYTDETLDGPYSSYGWDFIRYDKATFLRKNGNAAWDFIVPEQTLIPYIGMFFINFIEQKQK